MTSAFTLNEQTGRYLSKRSVSADEILDQAQAIIAKRFARGTTISDPSTAKQYLILQLARYEYEVFCCLFLDNRHRVIAFEELFRGTLTGCTVHARELVKTALLHNAAAVILAHNHPSGVADPSRADINLTSRLKEALSLIDVRVLDHLVVGAGEGLGIVALPAYTCRGELASGKLVKVLPEWQAGQADLSLMMPRRSGFAAPVVALQEFLQAEFAVFIAMS